jgi:hypothetical protein
MKICIYTFHSKTYAPLAELTETNKREYAARHGYDFRGDLIPDGPGQMHIGFARVQRILGLIERSLNWGAKGKPIYDWIFATGCDSMITNFTITLESIIGMTESSGRHPDVIAGTDAIGWNADSFIIRCNERAAKYFTAVMGGMETYLQHPFAEQSALNALREMAMVCDAPQRVMNSYDYWHYRGFGGKYLEGVDAMGNDGKWQQGDFVIHWPATSLELRLKLAREMEPKIIKAFTSMT